MYSYATSENIDMWYKVLNISAGEIIFEIMLSVE